jgi:hypothetical protein
VIQACRDSSLRAARFFGCGIGLKISRSSATSGNPKKRLKSPSK